MEPPSPNYWWIKNNNKLRDTKVDNLKNLNLTSTPKQSEDPSTISSSLKEFLDKERALKSPEEVETDIGSIIEEINRLAAESPLGPYDKDTGDRSFEEIMKEAEKIYNESSKSFEQLSVRSRTSANLSISLNDSPKSSPTPKSASPLPLDPKDFEEQKEDSYSEDFDEKSEVETPIAGTVFDLPFEEESKAAKAETEIIKQLEDENKNLLDNIANLKAQLEEEKVIKSADLLKSPEINLELERALEQLKDTKETNTALQIQLDALNKTHVQLKSTYEELVGNNSSLERRVADTEAILSRYKGELDNVKEHRLKLQESESSLAKQLENERTQVRTLKFQNEKDARCILDLNRQVKEMERIIARKHPDSVSALIVAAKNDQSESNLSTRKLLEERIQKLEAELAMRDQQSSKVFLEVQEKFTEMKMKYESHIEDLELHVNDLKDQLKHRGDVYDIYTQTTDEQRLSRRDSGSQTASVAPPKVPVQKIPSTKRIDKEDAHLLATIRGLQADLVNKEKVVAKLQKELDEARKTNKRLQKEREGSLRNIAERKEFRSFPEKLALQVAKPQDLEEDLKIVKIERDKMKRQLCRMEEDYQNLKAKRLFDLSALQQAHEEEMASYLSNVTTLREQLDGHQIGANNLQEQLRLAKEQIELLTAEKEELIRRLHLISVGHEFNANGVDEMGNNIEVTHKKVVALEQKYLDRENRLRAVIHELVQKNSPNQSCQQCAARQQQLISYKNELDQILATVRTLA